MENVLFINACVRPDSRTRILAQEVLDCLGQPYTEVDLNREQYPAMDRQALELREDLRRTELRTHPRFAPAWQFAGRILLWWRHPSGTCPFRGC